MHGCLVGIAHIAFSRDKIFIKDLYENIVVVALDNCSFIHWYVRLECSMIRTLMH